MRQLLFRGQSRRSTAAIAILLGASACDRVFGIPAPFDGERTDDDADVQPGDDASTPCTMPEAFSSFDDAGRGVCTGIGAPNVGGEPVPVMRIEDGKLVVEPRPNVEEGNGCTVESMLFGETVFLEVSSIFAYPRSSVFFAMYPSDPGGIQATFSAAAGRVTLMTHGASLGQIAFVENQWWRFRADRPGARVVGEVSPDGRSWTVVGEVPGTVPASIKLAMGAVITDTSASAPGAARFEHVNVCP